MPLTNYQLGANLASAYTAIMREAGTDYDEGLLLAAGEMITALAFVDEELADGFAENVPNLLAN